MIPICCWGLKPETRQQLFSLLDQQTKRYGVASRVVFSGDADADFPVVLRVVEEMDGIGLLVMGLSDAKEKLKTQTFDLARSAVRKNRYHFILYVMEDCADIERMLTLCIHPFSILTSPLDVKLTEIVLTNMLNEYQELVQPNENDGHLLVQNGGTHIRLACKEIVCVESLEKKLIIHYGAQMFSVYGSMSDMESKLGSSFLRCHRSYLVNSQKIQAVNMPEMVLTLENGNRVPISRSGRAILRSALKSMEGGEP